MAKQSKITWSKMDFQDFIDHFKGKSRDEIADDVIQSIKDFEHLNTDSDSFGSEQVKKAVCTSRERRAEASRTNGKLGGRPPKNATELRPEAPISEPTSTTLPPTMKRPPCPLKRPNKVYRLDEYKRRTPLPRSADDVMDIAFKCKLDRDDAYQWYQMSIVERRGTDRYGIPLSNWPGACIRFCQAKAARRVAAG